VVGFRALVGAGYTLIRHLARCATSGASRHVPADATVAERVDIEQVTIGRPPTYWPRETSVRLVWDHYGWSSQ
jgi:hypothetical protein